MYNNYVREATEEEMAIYNKVENAFNDEEVEDFFNMVCDEDLGDLLKNRIKSEEVKAIMKAKGLTAKEVCTWYFIG